jgi:hypothetical protein
MLIFALQSKDVMATFKGRFSDEKLRTSEPVKEGGAQPTSSVSFAYRKFRDNNGGEPDSELEFPRKRCSFTYLR